MTIRSDTGSVTSESPSPSPGAAVAQAPPDADPLRGPPPAAGDVCRLAGHRDVDHGGVAAPGRRARRSWPWRSCTWCSAATRWRGCSGTSGGVSTWFRRRGRLAWSDLVLALLTLNVLVSGTYDLVSGNQVILHPRAVGIPFRDIGWHVLSALVLLVVPGRARGAPLGPHPSFRHPLTRPDRRRGQAYDSEVTPKRSV